MIYQGFKGDTELVKSLHLYSKSKIDKRIFLDKLKTKILDV